MKNQRLFSPECSQQVSQKKHVQLSEAMLNLKKQNKDNQRVMMKDQLAMTYFFLEVTGQLNEREIFKKNFFKLCS